MAADAVYFIVAAAFDLAPVPCLKASFSVLKFIWDTVEESNSLKSQWKTLSGVIATLLKALDDGYKAGRIKDVDTKAQLDSLEALLQEILQYKKTETQHGFLKSVFLQGDHISAIEQFHRRIAGCLHAFSITSLLSVQHWQEQHTKARQSDQEDLNTKLNSLESNQNLLSEMLRDQHSSMMAMMVSLQKSIDKADSSARQKQFYSHSLKYLSTTSGEHVDVSPWMVTSFEIEFGDKIGSGGFGQVFKGVWNKTPVALKVFQAETGGVPSSGSIRREIDAWINLRHPHVLQFLGANVVDDRPFIVMPLMKHGNARDYIANNRAICDRLKIVHEACLGLVHLHSQNVIHGDLKGLNILIDNAGTAVLCDFGLSRIRADASSRLTLTTTSVAGSRNWMSPERLMGGTLKKPVDIYAFGMTIYELFTEDTPLGHIDYQDFRALVVDKDVRPEQPDEEDAPELTDDIWGIAERCWVKNPKERPTATIVCDDLIACINNRKPRPTAVSLAPPKLFTPASPSPSSIPSPIKQPYFGQAGAALPALPSQDSESSIWKAQSPAKAAQVNSYPGYQVPVPQQATATPISGATLVDASSPRPERAKPLPAEVTRNYFATKSDEISINKGERVEILDRNGTWWIARKADGKEGIIPSTYVKIISTDSASQWKSLPDAWGKGSSILSSGSGSVKSRSSTINRAKAKHAYRALREHELTFSKGEMLEILDNREQWWIARNQSGVEGLIPSNYVQSV